MKSEVKRKMRRSKTRQNGDGQKKKEKGKILDRKNERGVTKTSKRWGI